MISSRAAENEKPALRRAAMARRDALPADGRARASQAIAARCNALIAVLQPRAIAGYLPIRSEVDPRPILDRARAGGAEIALPATTGSTTMVFRRYDREEPMTIGGFGTLAPAADAPIVEPDLILLPVVGFDRMGTRLGHGLGFYDRAIAGLTRRPPLLGIAFSVQEVALIPRQAHDVRLDWIVTESEVVDFRGNA
jgi:5-formyltetrahydrofolate cyclo-ligase